MLPLSHSPLLAFCGFYGVCSMTCSTGMTSLLPTRHRCCEPCGRCLISTFTLRLLRLRLRPCPRRSLRLPRPLPLIPGRYHPPLRLLRHLLLVLLHRLRLRLCLCLARRLNPPLLLRVPASSALEMSKHPASCQQKRRPPATTITAASTSTKTVGGRVSTGSSSRSRRRRRKRRKRPMPMPLQIITNRAEIMKFVLIFRMRN